MSEKNTLQELNLEDFSLENLYGQDLIKDDNSLDFFSDKNLDKDEEKEPEVELEEEKDDETKTPEKAELENDEVKLDEKGEDKKDDIAPEQDTPEEFLPFYTALNEKLGIDGEPPKEQLEKGLDGVLDYLKDLAQNTIESELDEIKSLGDGLMGNLYEYLRNGGNPEKFVDTYFKQEDFASLAVEGEANLANQKKVVTKSLELQGLDADEIAEKLDDYENAGILEKEAKTAQKKVSRLQDQDKVNLLKQQDLAKKEADNQREQYWNDVKSTIKNSTEIGGLPTTDVLKENLIKHLTVKGKDGLTDYERNLRTKKDRALTFAYADMLNFDFSVIERKAKTEVSKDVKKALSRFTDNGSKTITKSRQTDDAKSSKADKPDYQKFKLPWG